MGKKLKKRKEKRGEKELLLGVAVSLVILVVLVSVLFFLQVPLAGLIVYEEQEATKTWDFSNSEDYTYNSELLEINEGTVQLVSTTTVDYWNTTTETICALTTAWYNPNDKTNKLNSLDNKKLEVEEDEILDLLFNDNLENGEVISIYINDGDGGQVYLCEKGALCSSSNYGSVNYEEDEEGWYNITITGLNSPTKVFNLHPLEETKINYVTSSRGEINSALYNPKDKTSKVNALDQTRFEVNKNKLFNLIFEGQINNDDIISLYLKSGSNTDIYLCGYGESCDSPGYGLVSYDGNEGWYNITVNGLSSSTDSFNLDPLKVKIDYLKATNIEVEEHSETNVTYPPSAEIETPDLEPAGLKNWETFASDEELNGYTIGYQYSTDSGETWLDLPEGGDLSSVESGKIRFKAILNSDETGTPALSQMSLSYLTQFCTENWSAYYGDCLPDDTRLKYYLDLNECGTIADLPSDNSTFLECDFCTPQLVNLSWTEWEDAEECPPSGRKLQNRTRIQSDANNCGEVENVTFSEEQTVSCDFCTPQLVNLSWTEWEDAEECPPSGRKLQNRTRIQSDANNCGEVENLTFSEEQTVDCDYCALNNCSTSFEENISADPNEMVEVRETLDANVKLEINASSKIENATVSIVEYNWSAVDSNPEGVVSLGRYQEINSDLENVNSVKIIVYYTDEELAAGNVAENTLRIHYYNETSGEWEELDSVVNASGNYVSALVDHFSLYGLFGEVSEESGSSGSGSSGGGGSGGGFGIRPTTSAEEMEEEEIPLKANLEEEEKELVAEMGCDYVLEVSLPETISFLKEDSYEGEIINKGNCEIQKLNLYASPEFSSVVDFFPLTIEHLAEGNKSTLQIIRRSEEKSSWFSPPTGSAIAERIMAKKLSGTITLEGMDGKEFLFSRDLPLDIEILAPEKLIRALKIVSPGVGYLLFFVIFTVVMVRKRRRGLGRG